MAFCTIVGKTGCLNGSTLVQVMQKVWSTTNVTEINSLELYFQLAKSYNICKHYEKNDFKAIPVARICINTLFCLFSHIDKNYFFMCVCGGAVDWWHFVVVDSFFFFFCFCIKVRKMWDERMVITGLGYTSMQDSPNANKPILREYY